MNIPKIVGIVNITADSFSDGGKFIESEKAILKAGELLATGADIVELSGVSSNPRSKAVPTEVQIARMEPVLAALRCHISIDATNTEVQRWALSKSVSYLNDIKGFPDESLYPELAKSNPMLVVMHSISNLDKAVRVEKTVAEVFDSVYSFFEKRIARLLSAGIPCGRLIIDPGMGFFLAENPEPSLAVLADISEFKKRFDLPVMISVSRKSFLRNISPSSESDIGVRTLAAELFAAVQGVDYIRTHDARALKEAIFTYSAIESRAH
ncbi:MAG: dihydropteroate synthase type-2 [Candidatus Parcubacteria bacterium]|jgi:dihydropteroate synthase type 2